MGVPELQQHSVSKNGTGWSWAPPQIADACCREWGAMGVLEQGDNMIRPMLWEDDCGNCGWQSQAWDREDWTPLCSGSGDKGSHPQKTAESAVFPR